mgnify:CR=1 FL=1
MARPAKSVNVKTGAISSEEENIRKGIESKLRGTSDLPLPPDCLTHEQKVVFQHIVDELRESDILGKLDVYVLESTAVAISRLRKINDMVNDNDNLLFDAKLQNARAKYQSDMWRGANELCLSPQARAKIGSLAAQAVKQKEDPLLKVIGEEDD